MPTELSLEPGSIWSVAIGDLEYPLRGRHARELQHWASAWLDLIQVGQMLHMALEMEPSDLAHEIYTRRALLDDAVVTYGRLFNSGGAGERSSIMPENFVTWLRLVGMIASLFIFVACRAGRDLAIAYRSGG